MKKRAKLKKKIIVPYISIYTKIFLIIIILIISLFISFKILNKKAAPIFISYSESEINKLTNIIINKAISKQLVENADIDKLYFTQKNDKNEIISVDFNSVVVNKFLSTTATTIQMYLRQVEEGQIDFIELPDDMIVKYDKKKDGIIYEIPIGVIFNNSFLSNLGPKIPVKFSLIGDISTGISTKLKNYGINSALIEVNLNIEVNQKVILPFISKNIKVKGSVPISIKLMQGNIPNYYINGFTANSSLYNTSQN